MAISYAINQVIVSYDDATWDDRVELMKSLSPAQQVSAFDNIDAWAEVGELNYIAGFVAALRTREFARNGLLPPIETLWPAIYYAADRAWTGKQTIVRELFPQRFITRFFGTRELGAQSRLWAGFDQAMSGNPALVLARTPF